MQLTTKQAASYFFYDDSMLATSGRPQEEGKCEDMAPVSVARVGVLKEGPHPIRYSSVTGITLGSPTVVTIEDFINGAFEGLSACHLGIELCPRRSTSCTRPSGTIAHTQTEPCSEEGLGRPCVHMALSVLTSDPSYEDSLIVR